MPSHLRLHRELIPLLTLACTLATTSIAAAQANRDLAEISAYRLTESGLAKYSQAIRNLGPLAANMPEACNDDSDDSEGAQGIDDAAAKLEAVPGVQAALASAGISAHEYVVFTFSLVQNGMASWALEQPGGKLPDGVSMDNVNFYRAHTSALQQLELQARSTRCGDAESGDQADRDEAETE